VNATVITAASPALMPMNAAAGPPRFSAPRKKTPRIGPLMSEATESAVFSAERASYCNATPTAIWATPATMVMTRERRIALRSSRGRARSATTVAAIAFSDDDIAAARIAATTSPVRPTGRWLAMKCGNT
jgi:hypothetical protein